MGKTNVLNELFEVKYHSEDLQRINKDKRYRGIREVNIKHEEINKLYFHFMKWIKIDHDTKVELFYFGLLEAFNSIKRYDNEKEVYSYIQTVIKRQFDEEYKRISHKVKDGNEEFTINRIGYVTEQYDQWVKPDTTPNEPITDVQRFLASEQGNIKESLKTEAQKHTYDGLIEGKEVSEIAKERGLTVSAISQQKKKIEEVATNKFDRFISKQKKNVTYKIADFLEHINRMIDYYDVSEDIMFYDVFNFVKEEYLLINHNIAEFSEFQKKSHKTTLIDILGDNMKPNIMNKLVAMLDSEGFNGKPKQEGESVQQFTYKGREQYITKKERKSMTKHILGAFYDHINSI